MRRKRHRLLYEVVGLVSRQKVEQTPAFAKALVEEVRGQITGSRG